MLYNQSKLPIAKWYQALRIITAGVEVIVCGILRESIWKLAKEFCENLWILLH